MYERRGRDRAPVHYEISFRPSPRTHDSSSSRACIDNLSLRGAALSLDADEQFEFRVGAKLELELQIPGLDYPLFLLSEVRWVNPDDKSHAGVRFLTHMTPSEIGALASLRWVGRALRRKPLLELVHDRDR